MAILNASYSRQLGGSLVEFMLASALSLLSIAAIGGVYVTGMKTSTQRSQELLVLQGLSDTLTYIKQDALRAGYRKDNRASAALLIGSTDIIHTTSSSLAYSYFDGHEYQNTFFKLDGRSVKLCSKGSAAPISITGCGRFFHLLDEKRLVVNDFSVSNLPLGSRVSSAYVTIRLSASLKDGRFPHTMTTSIKQRNWQ